MTRLLGLGPLGKEGMDFCPDLGAANNLAVALYGYAFLDGMVQHNGVAACGIKSLTFVR